MEKIDRKNLKLDLNGERKLSHSDALRLITEFFQKNNYKYSRKELKSIQIRSIETLSIHKYVLETFYETREFSVGQKPFTSGNSSLSSNEAAWTTRQSQQDLWRWEVKPKQLFQDETKSRAIDESSVVEVCASCEGKGTEKCKTCNGHRTVKCGNCKGEGVISPPVEMLTYETPLYDQVLGRSHINNTYHYGTKKFNEKESGGLNKSKNDSVYNNMFYKLTCDKCKGTKSVSCGACNKNGQIECFDCAGTGKCVRFVELKSSFHTRVNASYDTNSRIPTHLLDESLTNNVFYEQKDQKLNAISENSTLASLSEISHELLSQHSTHKDNTRILAQRHYANRIPVTVCKFIIDNKPKQILVYGFQQGVFDPERRSANKCSLL